MRNRKSNSNILITGGAGYIGSHTAIELLNLNYKVFIIDNFSNASIKNIDAIKRITKKKFKFIKCDFKNYYKLNSIFKQFNFHAVIHFAGLKSVQESFVNPIKYYENNVYGSINLVKCMKLHGVKKIIFSSSASVYDAESISPIDELSKLDPSSPYGKTKLSVENILYDIYCENKNWSILNLRYFNPIGCHKSSLISENSSTNSVNLMPKIINVAKKNIKYLEVYGNDNVTPDGSGIRDFLNINDLVNGHCAALKLLLKQNCFYNINIGTGRGTSVLKLINIFEKANKVKVPYKIIGKKKGDDPIKYASARKAKRLINWSSQYSLIDACKDVWKAEQLK
jgi:UDP-glucose 4-epimerase